MKRSLFVMITVAAICCFAGCAQKAEHKTVKEEKAASTTSDTTQYKSEPKGDIDVLKKSYPDWIKNGEVNYPYILPRFQSTNCPNRLPVSSRCR